MTPGFGIVCARGQPKNYNARPRAVAVVAVCTQGSRDHGGIRRDHGLRAHGNIGPEYHGISEISIYKFTWLCEAFKKIIISTYKGSGRGGVGI